jgi:hypothetical protein
MDLNRVKRSSSSLISFVWRRDRFLRDCYGPFTVEEDPRAPACFAVEQARGRDENQERAFRPFLLTDHKARSLANSGRIERLEPEDADLGLGGNRKTGQRDQAQAGE